MNKLNPNAVCFWLMLSLGFHLIGWNWAVGLFIGTFISFLAGFIKQ